MICPNCFANNKNNAAVCKSCGASLTDTENDISASSSDRRPPSKKRATYSAEEVFSEESASMPVVETAHNSKQPPADGARRRTRGEHIREYLDYDTADAPSNASAAPKRTRYTVEEFNDTFDDAGEPTAENDEEAQDAYANQQTICISPLRDGGKRARTNHAVPEEKDDQFLRPSKYSQTPTHSSKKRTANIVITIIVWILVLLLLGAAVYFGVTKLLPALQFPDSSAGPTATAGTEQFPNTDSPVVSVRTDDSGNDYIDAVFYGQAGDSIYLEVTKKYYTFESNVLNIQLYLKDLINAETQLLNPTLPINLQAKYRLASGMEKELETGTQTLNVPEGKITLLYPQQESVEIYKQNYTVIFSVDPGSTLTINDLPANDKMDSSGKVSYMVSVNAGETVSLNIKAYTPYCQMTVKTVTVSRSAMDVSFTLASANPKTTTQKSFTIQGTVDKEATLSCSDGYELSNVVINERTGAFTATVTLTQYGNHEVPITAALPSGLTSTLVYEVTYSPNETDYTTHAWKYDSKLITNPNAFKGKTFLLEATVEQLLPAKDTRFVINLGTEDAPERIVIDYYGTKSIKAGSAYRIFATVTDIYDGMPLLTSPFIYPPNY